MKVQKSLKDVIEVISNNIILIRNYQNLNQEELSKKSGVSVGIIKDIERRKKNYNPTLKTILKLFSALGVYWIEGSRRKIKPDEVPFLDKHNDDL